MMPALTQMQVRPSNHHHHLAKSNTTHPAQAIFLCSFSAIILSRENAAKNTFDESSLLSLLLVASSRGGFDSQKWTMKETGLGGMNRLDRGYTMVVV